jgi:NADH-quinone oxidoreductase subunit N
MLILMFSLAGIPPTVGFYAKLAVLQSVLATGQVWLAVVSVMLSLIGAYYYLRIIKTMYFDDPVDTAPIGGHSDMRAALSVNGLAVLALGILPGPLMTVCATAIVKTLSS